MFKKVIVVLLFAAVTNAIPKADPNQAKLDLFTQFPNLQVSDSVKNFKKGVDAQYSGECAAALDREGENIAVWDWDKKKCNILKSSKTTGTSQFRKATADKSIEVTYSLGFYSSGTPVDATKTTPVAMLKNCDITERGLSARTSLESFNCIKLIPAPKAIMLVRGV